MSGMISFTQKGDFSKTDTFFEHLKRMVHLSTLDKYGQMGVRALEEATPRRTGKTASSWYYEIEKTDTGEAIRWYNSNVNKGVNIALIIQTGHGTRGGYYVRGTDYINPAMRSVFDDIGKAVWEEVTK